MTAERFKCLLDRYLEGILTFNEKNEFFQMLCTGDYDEIIGNDFDKTITQMEVDPNKSLNGDFYSNLKKMILKSQKINFY